MVTATLESTTSGSSFANSQYINPTIRSILFRFVQVRTASDALPFFLNVIVTSGKMSGLVFLGIYLFFILLWLPFWLLTFVLTEYGVYAIAVASIFFLGRAIIRLIAFPGASSKVVREIEAEFARYSVRMLVSSCTCILDLANAIESISSSSPDSAADGNRGASSFAYYQIPGLWKRAKSYRDRAMGVYLDVLKYIYDPSSQMQLSSNSQQDPHRTKYGMNRISGDIGNLSGLTLQAKTDGRELMKLLQTVLSQIDKLEEQASSVLNASGTGGGARTGSISEEARTTAKELLGSVSELRDFVSSLKPPPADRDDDDEFVSSDTLQRRNQELTENAFETIQSGAASILPMIDPPLHTSIFGFDVQRGCMLSRYLGARQIWVRRPQGGMIDVIHIPAKSHGASLPRNSKAVLYCNPNAGLIEVAAGMSLAGGNVGLDSDDIPNDSTWTDFYTELGYDVYLFNYAGFGRSYGTSMCVSGRPSDEVYASGWLGKFKRIMKACFLSFKPTPDTLRGDGLTVANYLVGEAGVNSLVVHGESIGGVAASATARYLSNSISAKDKICLLLCDRTFCNLEAVAQRLVGGWSGYAIRGLAPFWSTDVAGDFVGAICPKVVATDFADVIISDSSSLKSGISLWREVKRGVSTTRGVGWILETPLEYRMADWENVCVNESKYFASNSPVRTQAPMWHQDKHVSLEEAFHFAACVKRIGRMAKQGGLSIQSDEENGMAMSNVAELPDSSSSIFEAWRTLAVCDGLCGAPLGAAVKSGFDSSVSWLCACLTYGGQTVIELAEQRLAKKGVDLASLGHAPELDPSDFDGRPEGFEKDESEGELHPKPIPEVAQILKGMLEGDEAENVSAVAYELKYVINMLEYIVARLSSPAVAESSWKCRHLKNDETRVGCFLNLHCGHNNSYSKSERMRLKELLAEALSGRG